MVQQEANGVLKDILHKGWVKVLHDKVIPCDEFRQTVVICHGVQCLLHKLFRPTTNGGAVFVDVLVNPAELLQLTSVTLSVFQDKVPARILVIFGRGCAHSR